MVNGPDGPVTAQAPITFRDGSGPAGAIEFHLAVANLITPLLVASEPIIVMVHGPGAHVSPVWFSASFPLPSVRKHFDRRHKTGRGGVVARSCRAGAGSSGEVRSYQGPWLPNISKV
ncbi:FMN-binding negative transcriptional regulator [Sphingomonas montana]|uniref:FMN-binding negative transcriptional regulator n=1 Tax=Sphingomonas montana TaxID=1843236 RepID=UPI003B833F6E